MPVPDIIKQMPVPAFLMHSSFLRLAAYRPLLIESFSKKEAI